MQVIHALQPLPKSIFLAGPTPRDEVTPTWRVDALGLLRGFEFDGTVYVPESADWSSHDNYDAQVQWEWEAIATSTVVAFWIPRDLETMPAFTTNVEFGLTVASSKVLLGYPLDAPKCSYLAALARRYNVPIHNTMFRLMCAAVERTQGLGYPA